MGGILTLILLLPAPSTTSFALPGLLGGGGRIGVGVRFRVRLIQISVVNDGAVLVGEYLSGHLSLLNPRNRLARVFYLSKEWEMGKMKGRPKYGEG